jgi:hypothetical protein
VSFYFVLNEQYLKINCSSIEVFVVCLVHSCTQKHTHTHIHILYECVVFNWFVYMCVHVSDQSLHTPAHTPLEYETYAHTHTHTHTHTYTHIHTHTHTHTYTHTHTHTHTNKHTHTFSLSLFIYLFIYYIYSFF